MSHHFSASSSGVVHAVAAAAALIVSVSLFLAVVFGLTGEDPGAFPLAQASVPAEVV